MKSKNEFVLLNKLKGPEVTTSMLMGVLNGYQDVRGKINTLCKKGLIQSIKQGVYLVSDDLGFRPYSKEILANLIYGPSYISLETALAHYGFIPERVETTTSICFGRGKLFATPVGDFEYHSIKKSIYSVGVQLEEVFKDFFCQYATPEKALLDFIHIKESKGEFKKQSEYFDFICDSYRLDLKTIKNQVSLKKMQALAKQYPLKHVHWFADELTRKLIK